VARLLAVLLLTLRGTPFIYYGEEIAMRTEPPSNIDEVRDPVGRTFWPRYKGRDGVRRPMQWDGSAGGGFTQGVPWLPLVHDAGSRHVAAQIADPRSPLNIYRALTRLRRSHSALRAGRYRTVCRGPDVFAFERTSGAESIVVCLNMTAKPALSSSNGPALSLSKGPAHESRVVFGTHRAAGEHVMADSMSLAGFEAVIIER
jgi:alpha-glucosidase